MQPLLNFLLLTTSVVAAPQEQAAAFLAKTAPTVTTEVTVRVLNNASVPVTLQHCGGQEVAIKSGGELEFQSPLTVTWFVVPDNVTLNCSAPKELFYVHIEDSVGATFVGFGQDIPDILNQEAPVETSSEETETPTQETTPETEEQKPMETEKQSQEQKVELFGISGVAIRTGNAAMMCSEKDCEAALPLWTQSTGIDLVILGNTEAPTAPFLQLQRRGGWNSAGYGYGYGYGRRGRGRRGGYGYGYYR